MPAPAAERRSSVRQILVILLVQSALGLAVGLLALASAGGGAMGSALLGTLAVVLPNAFLGLRLALSSADGLLRAMWLGEVGKIALTVVILGAVLASLEPAPAWLLLGFVAAQLGAFSGLLLPTDNNTGT